MKNIFAFLMFFISVAPASFAQTIGEYVDLENQIVRKRLLEELNKPAQGATTPSPGILPGQGNVTAPVANMGIPEVKGEKVSGPKTTAIYGINDNGHGQYKSVVEWNGSRFEAQPGSLIKGYRVESIDKSGTMMVRSGKGPASRVFAPSAIVTDGVK